MRLNRCVRVRVWAVMSVPHSAYRVANSSCSACLFGDELCAKHLASILLDFLRRFDAHMHTALETIVEVSQRSASRKNLQQRTCVRLQSPSSQCQAGDQPSPGQDKWACCDRGFFFRSRLQVRGCTVFRVSIREWVPAPWWLDCWSRWTWQPGKPHRLSWPLHLMWKHTTWHCEDLLLPPSAQIFHSSLIAFWCGMHVAQVFGGTSKFTRACSVWFHHSHASMGYTTTQVKIESTTRRHASTFSPRNEKIHGLPPGEHAMALCRQRH
jgi:hypothetical protein